VTDTDVIPTRPNAEPQPAQRLGALVGRWRSEGYLVDDPHVRIHGTDTYALLPGGTFLVHYVDVLVGSQPVQAVELISPDESAAGTFTARAYDHLGTVTVMQASVDAAGVWTFTGGSDVAPAARSGAPAPEAAARSTLTVSDDRTQMAALWERTDDGATWQPWMDMTFTRESAPSDEDSDSAFTAVRWAEGPADSAAEQLRRLDALAGRWSWQGQSHSGDFAVTGETDLRWLAGGRFLVEKGALESAGQVSQSFAIVGWDPERHACMAEYVDDLGVHDRYELSLDGEQLSIRWAKVRFAGRLDQAGETISGVWEQTSDGSTWDYWYDAELRRI